MRASAGASDASGPARMFASTRSTCSAGSDSGAPTVMRASQAVQARVVARRDERLLVVVDRPRAARAERERGDREHAGAAPIVEHLRAGLERGVEPLETERGSRMLAGAEREPHVQFDPDEAGGYVGILCGREPQALAERCARECRGARRPATRRRRASSSRTRARTRTSARAARGRAARSVEGGNSARISTPGQSGVSSGAGSRIGSSPASPSDSDAAPARSSSASACSTSAAATRTVRRRWLNGRAGRSFEPEPAL